MVSKPLNPSPPTPTPTKTIQDSLGVFLAFGVIIALAISRPGDVAPEMMEEDVFDVVAENILGAVGPSSSTDLVAAALGESIGGVLGASFGSLVTMIGMMQTGADFKANDLVTEAIADSDFFIANSASMPLLRAAGLPPEVASVVGPLLAAIPSQFVKANSKEKDRRRKEKVLLDMLQKEEEDRKRKKAENPFLKPFMRSGEVKTNSDASADPTTESLAESFDIVKTSKLDVIEIFSDCTRWLAYGVLQADFGETMIWNGLILDQALTGALYGVIAAVSSQLYADLFYGVFRYGPKEKQEKLFERSSLDWLAVYVSRSVSTASLFGVYEFSQGPIAQAIQGTLAGGVDGCVGSSEFDLCLQTYIDDNAPGPSAEAQFRALVVNLSIVYQRLQDIAIDTSLDDFKTLAHEWSKAIFG